MSLRNFFYLSATDRNFIAAFCIVACVGCVAYVLSTGNADSALDGNGAAINVIGAKPQVAAPRAKENLDDGAPVALHGELSCFDPNTADSAQLARLGLRPWQVRNILRFRQRGGTYQRKEDFARVYGLTVADYRRLSPYIRIADDFKPAADLPEAQRGIARRYGATHGEGANDASSAIDASHAQQGMVHKLRHGEQVAVNTADTTQLMLVPGIGSYYARQIVRLRDRLGGITDARQLLGIDNFPEEALGFISVDLAHVSRLNVNHLGLQSLKRHPYINYYQARAIIDLRRLRGTITSIDELAELKEFGVDDLRRLAPYLEF